MTNLQKGDKAKVISERHRRILITDCGGKCSFFEDNGKQCAEHLTFKNSNIANYAHIIPESVGSFREDWKTPLEERNQPPNIIVMCQKHHKVIDDQPEEYHAVKLLKWKRDAEEKGKKWPDMIGSSPNLASEHLKVLLEAQETYKSGSISKVKEKVCDVFIEVEMLLSKNNMREATIMLKSIEAIVESVLEGQEIIKLRILKANAFSKAGDIEEAKEMYENISKGFPEDMQPQLSLAEIYLNEEKFDKNKKILDVLEKKFPDNPKIKIQKILRKIRLNEEILFDKNDLATHDDKDRASFYRLYSIYFNKKKDRSNRDAFIDRSIDITPDNLNGHLVKIGFIEADFFENKDFSMTAIQKTLDRINNYEEALQSKGFTLKGRDRVDLLARKLSIISLAYREHHAYQGELEQSAECFFQEVLQCHFDFFIDSALSFMIRQVFPASKPKLDEFLRYLEASEKPASESLAKGLLITILPFSDFFERVGNYFKKCGYQKYQEALNALKNKRINDMPEDMLMDSNLIADFIMRLQDPDIVNLFVEKISEKYKASEPLVLLTYYLKEKNYGEVIKIIDSIDLTNDQLNFNHLKLIGETAKNENVNRPDIAVQAFEKALEKELIESEEVIIKGELFSIASTIGDVIRITRYAEELLQKDLPSEKKQVLLRNCLVAFIKRGKLDEAKEILGKYREVPSDSDLKLLEADLLLHLDKKNAKKSLQLITEAYSLMEDFEDGSFLRCLQILNELENYKAIPKTLFKEITKGKFVKIQGLPRNWYYVGDGNPLDATKISSDDYRYPAIFGKKLGDIITLPRDYTEDKKTVEIILSFEQYLMKRAFEELNQFSQEGREGFMLIPVVESNFSTLTKAMDDLDYTKEYIEKYKSGIQPFSVLALLAGGIIQGLAKINSDEEGFIHFSTGNSDEIELQKKIAREAVKSKHKPVYMDGISALILAQTGLLSKIIQLVPSIRVSIAVIDELYKLSEKCTPRSGSEGSLSFIRSRPVYHAHNKETEEQLNKVKGHIINSINSLEDKYELSPSKRNKDSILESKLPESITDAYMLARKNKGFVITEDLPTLASYSNELGENIQSFSSWALLRTLVEDGKISWDDYLIHVSLLGKYRFRFIPLRVEDLIKTVFDSSGKKIISFTPEKLDYLQLRLLLSEEYGVDAKTAIGFITSFFHLLITDDTIPVGFAGRIFPRVFIPTLSSRKEKKFGEVIIQVCKSKLEKERFIVSIDAEQKIALLEDQIRRYTDGFDPLFERIPDLLSPSS